MSQLFTWGGWSTGVSALASFLPKKSQAWSPSEWILDIENPKDPTRKLLELINGYSKVAGYKINTQKSLAFLHTNNEKMEREIKETIPFTIATKRIKYLGIYLPKEIVGPKKKTSQSKHLHLILHNWPKSSCKWCNTNNYFISSFYFLFLIYLLLK